MRVDDDEGALEVVVVRLRLYRFTHAGAIVIFTANRAAFMLSCLLFT